MKNLNFSQCSSQIYLTVVMVKFNCSYLIETNSFTCISCTHTHTHTQHTHTCMHAHTHAARMHTRTLHTCTHAHMHECTHACIHTNTQHTHNTHTRFKSYNDSQLKVTALIHHMTPCPHTLRETLRPGVC